MRWIQHTSRYYILKKETNRVSLPPLPSPQLVCSSYSFSYGRNVEKINKKRTTKRNFQRENADLRKNEQHRSQKETIHSTTMNHSVRLAQKN